MNNLHHRRNKYIRPLPRGAALIMALLIIAIVAAIATDLISRSQIDIRRTDLILSTEQAEAASSYSLAWGEQIFLNQPRSDNPNENIPLPLPLVMPTYKIGNTTINATLSSAQSRFNINNLTDPAYLPLFSKLILLADSDTGSDQSIAIANDVAYFIGGVVNPQIEQVYATFVPPYRPAHRLMTSPSELRAVRGITATLYFKLLPYIIALPAPTPLDPSSASKIALLSYGITDSGADAVVNSVQNQVRFKNITEFYTLARFQPATTGTGTGTTLFDINPQYYLLTTHVTNGPIDWIIYSILQADKTNGKLILLQQTRNAL